MQLITLLNIIYIYTGMYKQVIGETKPDGFKGLTYTLI